MVATGSSIGNTPGYERSAFIYAPGIGYAVGNDRIGGITVSQFSFPADQELCEAVQKVQPPVYVAIWEYPAARNALG